VNFTVDDIHRSLRRYVALVLVEPFKVRTEKQPVTPDERPVAVVEAASGVSTGKSRVSIPQGPVEKLMAFSVMAYPAIPGLAEDEDQEPTARESRREAYRVQQLLDDAFTYGLVDGDGADAVNIGAPFRIPVYDYADVPVSGRNRQGPVEPYGYAWLADLSVRVIQDLDDPLRFTVTCDMRLSWEAGGRLMPPAPIVTRVPIIGRRVL
jgi:hypothetical protein